MSRMLGLAVGMTLVLSGCGSDPGAMLGKPLAEVERRFGKPDHKGPAQVTSDRRAPQPRLLSRGDRYLFVLYSSLKGRRWYLVFVTPEVFEKINGKNPGDAHWYLIEAKDYDKDLVF